MSGIGFAAKRQSVSTKKTCDAVEVVLWRAGGLWGEGAGGAGIGTRELL